MESVHNFEHKVMDFLEHYASAGLNYELSDLSAGQEVAQTLPNSVIESDATLSPMLLEVYRSHGAYKNAISTVPEHTLAGIGSSNISPAAIGESDKKR
jgi:hypothetical protein